MRRFASAAARRAATTHAAVPPVTIGRSRGQQKQGWEVEGGLPPAMMISYSSLIAVGVDIDGLHRCHGLHCKDTVHTPAPSIILYRLCKANWTIAPGWSLEEVTFSRSRKAYFCRIPAWSASDRSISSDALELSNSDNFTVDFFCQVCPKRVRCSHKSSNIPPCFHLC